MSAALKAGIIGLGVGERHIAGYQAHPACDVTALCDFTAEKRAYASAKYPEIPVVADANAVLDDPAIDVVSICSWDNYHFAQVMRALDAGKHVFVEKPLVLNIDEARAIRQKLRQNPELQLSSNLILRRCPRFRALRDRIDAGDFGELFYLEGDYNYGRIHKLLAGWRGEIDDYSMVLGGGVHMVDLLAWLAGDKIVEVSAYGNRIATASDGGSFSNFDLVVAILKFASGASGKITCNGGCVHPHFHRLNIYGTKASYLNDLPTGHLYTSRDPGIAPESVAEAYPGADKGDLLADLVESILTGREPEVTTNDVFESLAVCFAIERAVHSGSPVIVDDL